MTFCHQAHEAALLEVNVMIGRMRRLCDGLEPADMQMSNEQYMSAAAGAFGVMLSTLAKASELLSEASDEFSRAHNSKKKGDNNDG